MAELKQALAGPPTKRQGNYNRGPRAHKEKAAEELGAGAGAGSQQEHQEQEQPEQKGASSGCSSTAREQDDDGGSSVVSADGASRSGGGGGGGQRRGVKRGREQDGGHSSSTGTSISGSTSGSGVKAKAAVAAAARTGPMIEVLEDDTILVDGVAVCAPTDKWYAPLFGLASMEKHKDPEWHIANGIVDRCYYRGSKSESFPWLGLSCLVLYRPRHRLTHPLYTVPTTQTEEAKTRPGIDYFPTDQAMMADFVRRKPEVFITQVLDS